MLCVFALFRQNNKTLKMTKSGLFYFLMLLLLVPSFLTSCSDNQGNHGKPMSIGSTDEVLIVLQNDGQWQNQIGQTIKKYLAADVYGLPQPEPTFKLLHIKATNFNDLFQKQRDVIIVNIDPKTKEPKIVVTHDKWSAPQLIFTITAPSPAVFAKIFTAKKDYFIEKFIAFERQRIMRVFGTSLDDRIIKAINKNFSFSLNVPAGFYVAKTTPNFMWIRHEANRYSQGIMIVSVPYKDTAQFSRDRILSRIQEFQLHNIPGPTTGSYMSLDRKFLLPRDTLITDFPTHYAVEIRGLWRVEHDFMGGPFVSYTFLDENTNRIITLFGYVYFPSHKKRDLLLQVESILYSVKFDKAEKK
jgi:hypothetical protein